METNDRRYEDPALSEALGRIDRKVTDDSLPEGFEEWVMEKMRTPPLQREGSGNRQRRVYRVAAVFIGVLMLSGIAWAAWESRGQSFEPAHVESKTCPSDSRPVATEGDIVHFDNVQLDSVLAVVARHYQKQVDFRSDRLRRLHFHIEWNQAAPLSDFIMLINNFEGISLREEQDTIIAE